MSKKSITKSGSLKNKKSVGNPFGANQWVKDPRQQLFLAYYKDPESPTFSNALQSAIRAGFSEEYGSNILSQLPEWLSETIGNSPLLAKAERNLSEHLDLPMMVQAMGAFGPLFETVKVPDGTFKNGKPKFKKVKKPIMVYSASLLKIRESASEFIAEGVGRKKYGKKDGDDGVVNNIFIFQNAQRTKIARRIIDIGGGSSGD